MTTAELLQRHLPTWRVESVQSHLRRSAHDGWARPARNQARSSSQAMIRRKQTVMTHRPVRLRHRRCWGVEEEWRIQRDTPGYVRAERRRAAKDLQSAKRYTGHEHVESVSVRQGCSLRSRPAPTEADLAFNDGRRCRGLDQFLNGAR
jgi:hypothetical protein